MAKSLITGGAGFIGSNLAAILSEQGEEVVVLDNLKSGYLSNLAHLKNIEFIEGDIRDNKLLKSIFNNINRVYHLAAEISVPASMQTPLETEDINTKGTINILKCAVESKVKSFFFASSAAVYGDSEVCPKKTDMLPAPVSPYAISKLSGEYYTSMFAREYGLNAVIGRFFNVFGERQDPTSPYSAAIPVFISRAISGSDISIYGDGTQTRDFIFVKDLCRIIISLCKTNTGLYNIGYGEKTIINNLVNTIISKTGSKSKVIYAPKRSGDVRFSFADSSETLKLIPFELDGFEKGLQITIEHYKSKLENTVS